MPEIDRRVQVVAPLEQHVAPADAEVGGAVLDVGRHVVGLQQQKAQRSRPPWRAPGAGRRRRAAPCRCPARSKQRRQRLEDAALGDRDRQRRGPPRCASRVAALARRTSPGSSRVGADARRASARCARSRGRGDRRAAPRSRPRRRPGPAMTSEALARRSVAITCAPESGRAAVHVRGVAVDVDVGAHARELGHVHEAVLEDGLGDARCALRPGTSAP